jgi:hypothetical protein
VDSAPRLRECIDEQFPHAEKIVRLMNHRHTYKPASLYEVFALADARRLLQGLEIYHTHKLGSRLTIAET